MNSAPIVDRIRIIPRAKDFLDRSTGSSGEIFFSKETNTLRVYSGRTANRGGFEVVTDESLRRNIGEQEVASVKYNVTINNSGSGNKYVLNGVEAPELSFVIGYTYVFDQTDPTNVYYPNPTGGANNQHALNFSADNANGEVDGGTSYLEGVKYILDGEEVTQEKYNTNFQRSDTRVVQITVTSSTPETLYYWCYRHPAMGNVITVGEPGAGSAGAGTVTASIDPPENPTNGSVWFDAEIGKLYVYLDDGDSQQWVQPLATASGGGVDLEAFSVTQNPASGGGSLTYDNLTGVFTYTPPEISGGGGSFDQTLNTTDDVVFASIEAASFTNTGVGTSNIESASTLTLTVGDALIVTGGPLRLPNLTEAQRDGLIAQNGDVIYNITSTKIEAYQNGTWIELDTGAAA